MVDLAPLLVGALADAVEAVTFLFKEGDGRSIRRLGGPTYRVGIRGAGHAVGYDNR